MSIALQLADKYNHFGSSGRWVLIAVNEALELAAQEAEKLYDKTYWDDSSAGIAATIRRLKSPAGPVQATDTSPAQRESDHAGL